MGRHLRPSRTDRRAAAGFTLVEVLLATMLTCVMITAVFSVSLTARRDSGKNDRRLLANQIARSLTSRLGNYVSGCCNSGGCNGANSSPACGLPGPNTNNGVNTWSLSDPVIGISDSQGNSYALAAGEHDITGTGLIPSFFGSAPYNAKVAYNIGAFGSGGQPTFQPVALAGCGGISAVCVTWTEPNEQ